LTNKSCYDPSIETTKGIAPSRLRSLPSWLLGQAALQAQRLGTDHFAAAGSSRSHYAVLCALDEYGPASQIDLGRRCGFDRSDMVAIINDLVGQELVARRADTVDRRRNVITITAAGRRYRRKLDTVADAIQDELLAPLSAREREQLARLLRHVLDHN
jgi:MarR family transcriptional regulator, lower aerobic nicotinate degradation pathway regulator